MKGKIIVLVIVLLCFSLESMAQSGRGKQKKKKSFEELTTQLLNGEIDSVSYQSQTLEISNAIILESTIVQTMSIQTLSVGQIYYVNAAASGGDGLSWATAFSDLQNALSAAVSGDEIWVVQGTYKPTSTTTRTIYFNMRTGVALYGGFAGTEATREERDWRSNSTILSGEIGDLSIVTDNSDHVIYANSVSDIIIDGFIVEKGYSSSSKYGGGFHCSSSSNVLIQNCVFDTNSADYHGGGIYANSAMPLNVINTEFKNNRAVSYDGGGIFITGSGTGENVVGCLFYNNICGRLGGAMEVFGASCSVVNTTFTLNSANTSGTSVSSWSGNTSIYNSIIYWNNAPDKDLSRWGGGVINMYSTDIEVSTSYNTGENVIHQDPLFENVGVFNFKLQSASPCIDAGMTAISGITLPETDLGGNDRVFNEVVDMGAFEFTISGNTTYHAISSGNWNDGSIWSSSNGGGTINSIPTISDIVYISGYEITIDDDANCSNLILSNELPGTQVDLIDGILSVYGEIEIDNSDQNNGPAHLKVHSNGKLEVVEPE